MPSEKVNAKPQPKFGARLKNLFGSIFGTKTSKTSSTLKFKSKQELFNYTTQKLRSYLKESESMILGKEVVRNPNIFKISIPGEKDAGTFEIPGGNRTQVLEKVSPKLKKLMCPEITRQDLLRAFPENYSLSMNGKDYSFAGTNMNEPAVVNKIEEFIKALDSNIDKKFPNTNITLRNSILLSITGNTLSDFRRIAPSSVGIFLATQDLITPTIGDKNFKFTKIDKIDVNFLESADPQNIDYEIKFSQAGFFYNTSNEESEKISDIIKNAENIPIFKREVILKFQISPKQKDPTYECISDHMILPKNANDLNCLNKSPSKIIEEERAKNQEAMRLFRNF